jgi:hypothetical protein
MMTSKLASAKLDIRNITWPSILGPPPVLSLTPPVPELEKGDGQLRGPGGFNGLKSPSRGPKA